MKKIPLYRIIRHTYCEKCDVVKEEFTIEVKKKFLWLDIWSSIKQLDCYAGDCYKSAITFNTESDAIYAIKRLQNGATPDGWSKEVVTVLDFNR